jgi:hypothetical protein
MVFQTSLLDPNMGCGVVWEEDQGPLPDDIDDL